MLAFLWLKGDVMVAERQGGHRLWDLKDRCLPDWTPRQRMSPSGVVRAAAQRSLRALGVASPTEIRSHFIRDRYPGLPLALRGLEREGTILPIEIRDAGASMPGPMYIHAADLPLLDRIEAGEWQPLTTLLSPFDNLICDRARTRRLFDFDFSLEIYLPVARRRYGYYVLPILHDDRLVGRVDAALNRAERRLDLKAVHLERRPETEATARSVAAAISELAAFLDARSVAVGNPVPRSWKAAIDASF